MASRKKLQQLQPGGNNAAEGEVSCGGIWWTYAAKFHHEWIKAWDRHGLPTETCFFSLLRMMMKDTHGNMKGLKGASETAKNEKNTWHWPGQMDCPQWLPYRGFQRRTFCVLIEAGHRLLFQYRLTWSDWPNCGLSVLNTFEYHWAGNYWMIQAGAWEAGRYASQDTLHPLEMNPEFGGPSKHSSWIGKTPLDFGEIGWGRMKSLEKNGKAWKVLEGSPYHLQMSWGPGTLGNQTDCKYGFSMAARMPGECAKELTVPNLVRSKQRGNVVTKGIKCYSKSAERGAVLDTTVSCMSWPKVQKNISARVIVGTSYKTLQNNLQMLGFPFPISDWHSSSLILIFCRLAGWA